VGGALHGAAPASAARFGEGAGVLDRYPSEAAASGVPGAHAPAGLATGRCVSSVLASARTRVNGQGVRRARSAFGRRERPSARRVHQPVHRAPTPFRSRGSFLQCGLDPNTPERPQPPRSIHDRCVVRRLLPIDVRPEHARERPDFPAHSERSRARVVGHEGHGRRAPAEAGRHRSRRVLEHAYGYAEARWTRLRTPVVARHGADAARSEPPLTSARRDRRFTCRANDPRGGGTGVPFRHKNSSATRASELARPRREEPALCAPARRKEPRWALPARGRPRSPRAVAQHHGARRSPQRPCDLLRIVSLASRCAASFAFNVRLEKRWIKPKTRGSAHFLVHTLCTCPCRAFRV
jgi:hypothetical protein